jgi:hypothetical protein
MSFYRAFVRVPSDAVDPMLTGRYYSDNRAIVFVDGAQASRNRPCGPFEGDDYGFGGVPAKRFKSLLTTGNNILSFKIENCGLDPTGVDFTVTARFTLYPTEEEQCDNGGWRRYTRRDGTLFATELACEKYASSVERS